VVPRPSPGRRGVRRPSSRPRGARGATGHRAAPAGGLGGDHVAGALDRQECQSIVHREVPCHLPAGGRWWEGGRTLRRERQTEKFLLRPPEGAAIEGKADAVTVVPLPGLHYKRTAGNDAVASSSHSPFRLGCQILTFRLAVAHRSVCHSVKKNLQKHRIKYN